MGIFSNIFGKNEPKQTVVSLKNDCGCEQVSLKEFLEVELRQTDVRNLAFYVCVEMIANAISLCELKNYENNEEIHDDLYWLWNYEPNANQNGTTFIKKIIHQLFYHGEVLVFETKRRDGTVALNVADSFAITEKAQRQNEYSDIVVGNTTFNLRLREKDVIHIVLDNKKIKGLVENIAKSYETVLKNLLTKEQWNNGLHLKVHINQIASGQDDFAGRITEMIKNQVKPFMESGNTILPEFDGYAYSLMETNGKANETSQEMRDTVEEIFNETAKAFLIPVVLVNGKVEATEDANQRFLTYVIDPLATLIEKEIIRKTFTLEEFQKGDFIKIDTSSIIHFDLFANASNVEKIVGSGCYTINDIRKSAGQVPINEPWAKKHYLTKNIGEVTALGEGKEE